MSMTIEVFFNLDYPLSRHTGEGRYPAKKNSPRSGQNLGTDPLRRTYSIDWIPAFAGMTDMRGFSV